MKIFYFTHVPWNWIKQRPQFIAEELSGDFQVDIFQEKPYVNNLTQATSELSVTSFFRLPANRFSFGRAINAWLMEKQIKPKIKIYDSVWLTSPGLYRSIKNAISANQKLIYDCMDDILAFPAIAADKSWKKEMEKQEKALIERADLVFCTSEHLKEKLINRYNIHNKDIIIVNNAINLYKNKTEIVLPENISNAFEAGSKNLTYIGTISAWFDFETVLAALNKYPDLQLFLFGPTEVQIPSHERITHFGSIPHELVYEVMKKAGVLIMPFVLNELILSVNPVKLYEYIYCEKIIIAKKYGETLKFEDYIYLYDKPEIFNNFVDQYYNGELVLKLPPEAYKNFGLANTWQSRVEQIKEQL